jgi:tetratricopeptide (TPR) repeat protein
MLRAMRFAAAALAVLGLLSAGQAQVALSELPALARARAERQRPAQIKALEPFLKNLSLEYKMNQEIVDQAISGAAALGDAIVPLLLENLTPKEDTQEARNLAMNSKRVLRQLDPSGFTDALIEIAQGRSETGRDCALSLLGSSKNPGAATALLSLLPHLKGREHLTAIDALTALAYAPATPAIVPLLQADDRRLRDAALEFLIAVKSQSAVEPAAAALEKEKDGALALRFVAYFGIAAKDNAVAAQAMLPLLADDSRAKLDKDQQTEVVKGLATVAPDGHAPTIKALKAILDRQEIGPLGVAAALTMRDIGDKRGVDILMQNLQRYIGDHKKEAHAYASRGEAYLALGRSQEAILDFREALKYANSFTLTNSLWFSIVQAEAKRERWPQVVQTLKEMKATYDAIQREMVRKPELLKAMQNESVRKYVESLKK